MSMLNFKHGLYGNLFNTDGSNKVDISNGTIYVTTDEKAMYVDLDGKRIRLSQIVNIPTTAEWQQLKPPFSKEAFYYILEANALLKFNGTDWVQINSTAELDALLAGLGFYSEVPQDPKDGDILVNDDNTVSIYDSKAEGTKWVSYGTVGSKLIDLSSRVATLETTIAGHNTDITALKAKDTVLETAITETRKAVGFLGKLEATPETGTPGQTVLVGNQMYIWLAAEGETPAGWQPIDSLGKRVEDLKARIEDVAATAGDQTAVDNLQTQLTGLDGRVSTLENAGYVTADGKVKMTGNLDLNSHKVVNVANPDANTDAANKAYVDTEVGKANQAAEAAQTSADNAATAATTAAELGQQGINDAAAALAEAQKKTTMAAVEAKGYATGTELTEAVAAARGETTETVASVDTKVSGHATRLTSLEKDVEDLEQDLLSKVQTADAMIYRGTVANEAELTTKSNALGGARIGDTYKVTEEFTLTNGSSVNIGDLLIASGTEIDGIISTETLRWDHVPSGYVANYNPKLSTATPATNVVDINLTSAHAADGTTGDLGDFQISAATDSAVTVNVIEGNNIAIGMTWGTF